MMWNSEQKNQKNRACEKWIKIELLFDDNWPIALVVLFKDNLSNKWTAYGSTQYIYNFAKY